VAQAPASKCEALSSNPSTTIGKKERKEEGEREKEKKETKEGRKEGRKEEKEKERHPAKILQLLYHSL
jgi:hypothetical protein